MKKINQLQEMLKTLRLTAILENVPTIFSTAKEEQPSYIDFLYGLLSYEIEARNKRAFERRMQVASFPYIRTLEEFSLEEQKSLSKQQFNQLTSLDWIDQSYNLVLLGPSGVGKTHISIGLGMKAIEEGYKVVFVTMGEIIRLLKTQEIAVRSTQKIKKMKESQMLILDDLMFMALTKQEANLFFHFVNDVYETTSIVLTSNKAPQEWGQLIGDEIIAAAILDRIVQKSEIINLSGESYRVKYRSTIFK